MSEPHIHTLVTLKETEKTPGVRYGDLKSGEVFAEFLLCSLKKKERT